MAKKYISALDRLDAFQMQSTFAKNAVEFDAAYGETWHGASTIAGSWAGVFKASGDTGWRGSLCCAGPNWAAVTWRWWGTTNPMTFKPFKMNGLSILEIKNGKITYETIYWDVPGRSPGVAPSIGRKYAAAMKRLEPVTISSLYSNEAIKVDTSLGQRVTTSRTIVASWQKALANGGRTHWQGSLGCAASFRLAGGTPVSWAVVTWAWSQSANPSTHKPFKTNGVSILQLEKGQITRETIYHDIPGR